MAEKAKLSMLKDLEFDISFKEDFERVQAGNPKSDESCRKESSFKGTGKLTVGPRVKLVIKGDDTQSKIVGDDPKNEQSYARKGHTEFEIETSIFEIFKAMKKSK
jgi:hypothetical protein